MGFDIVMCTTGSRPALLEQSLRSLKDNASDWPSHALTLVMDGCSVVDICQKTGVVPNRIIVNPERQGASRSRNIGAASTPTYLRRLSVMFCDEDIYAVKGWDKACYRADEPSAGHAHPFNRPIALPLKQGCEETSVLSTCHMVIPWAVWDKVGWFTEPGGAGGSEDVDWCLRAARKGHTFWVTVPQVILHTGLTSGSGQSLVGVESVKENNARLEKLFGITGEVVYA